MKAHSTLSWLQVLRGGAALAVLFFHLRPHWNLDPFLSKINFWFEYAFWGVDIFFVLSGFVVYRTAVAAARSDKSGFVFVLKRYLRIYLGYVPVFVAFLAYMTFVQNKSVPDAEKLIRSLLLTYPNIWDNVLPTAWSLTLELWFYLWITVIVFFLPNRERFVAGLCAFLVLWGVFWLVLNREAVYGGALPLRYWLSGLGVEFLAGALLAIQYEKSGHAFAFGVQKSMAVLMLVVMLLTAGTFSPWFDRVEVARISVYGLSAVMVVYWFLTLESTTCRPNKVFVIMGDASFSLYLLHPLLLDMSGVIRVMGGLQGGRVLTAYLLALPLAMVLIGWIWYRLVERPLYVFAGGYLPRK